MFKRNTYYLFQVINNDLVLINTYKNRDILDAFMSHIFSHTLLPDTLQIEKRDENCIRYSFRIHGEPQSFVLSDKEFNEEEIK